MRPQFLVVMNQERRRHGWKVSIINMERYVRQLADPDAYIGGSDGIDFKTTHKTSNLFQ